MKKNENMSFANKIEFYFKNFQSSMRSALKNKNTMRIHETCIIKFIQFCYENELDQTLKFSTFSSRHLNNYFEWLNTMYRKKRSKSPFKDIKNLSNSTRQAHLTALKAFLKYIASNNDEGIKINVLLNDYKVKLEKDKKLEIFMGTDERNSILNYVDNQLPKKYERKYNKNFRNSLLAKLVFKSGIRIEKTLNLKVGDFQDNTDEFYSVKILEETGKYETILVPKKLIKTDLDRIIKINDSEAYVFNTGKNPNKPLSLQTAYKIFKQIRLSI